MDAIVWQVWRCVVGGKYIQLVQLAPLHDKTAVHECTAVYEQRNSFMSLPYIKVVVDQFIANKHNDLLVIKGGWGVGKTYFWQSLMNDARKTKNVGKRYYSYVSLFGVNSIEELKNTIITTREDVKTSNTRAGLKDIKNLFQQLTAHAENFPVLRDYTGGIASQLVFTMMDDTIICFDDIERRGNELDIKDVMGLSSLLKEQRNCQIVFIMNAGSLSDDEFEEFRRHSEKIIDIELDFSPSAEDVFGYVFPEDYPYYNLIKNCCLNLDIRNIRILQRVKRFVGDLLILTEKSEISVIEDVIKSVILYVWSYYDNKGDAPTLEYIEKFDYVRFYMRKQNQNINPEEMRLNTLLISYDYRSTSDLQKYIMSLVKTGYVNIEGFNLELLKVNNITLFQRMHNAYNDAWKLYRNSFDNNENEFIQSLVGNFRSNIHYLSLSTLQSTIQTLRNFNYDDLIDQIINEYMEYHRSDIVNLNRENVILLQQIRDRLLIERLDVIWNSVKDERLLSEVIAKLSSQDGWDKEDIRFLSQVTVDDYYNFFKSEKSEALYRYIQTCLRFADLVNGYSEHKVKTNNAKEALKKIAAESRINQLRVSELYGIALDDEAPST